MIFVTGTGTGVGKTYLAAALLRGWVADGLQPAGLKPIETGCDPNAQDALELANACGRPELASLTGLYRAPPPTSPQAATLLGHTSPDLHFIASTMQSVEGSPLLIEGAGGPLVPIDDEHMIIDLAVILNAGVLLVTANHLGALSHTLTATESVLARGLSLHAIALTSPSIAVDPSQAHNAQILRRHISAPVFELPHADPPNMARAARALGRHLTQKQRAQ